VITTFRHGGLQNWPLNNTFCNSYCTWNMTLFAWMILFMELIKKHGVWWCNFHCILHQLCICSWELMVHSTWKHMLNTTIPKFQSYIGLIDGTLIKIRKPWNNPKHKIWFNGCMKIYSMNNTMVIDHQGLFLYLDFGYLKIYHDVTIFCPLELH
jgi:hypothetical protein